MPNQQTTLPAKIPEFALYGEPTRGLDAENVHIELIETRSRQHDWHIGTHRHAGLFQVLFLIGGRVKASIDGDRWECKGPVALTIHPSLAHGFDFSEEAHGYVLTIDQNVLFAAAGHEGDLFASLFVQPLTLALEPVPEVLERIEALLRNLIAEAAWPRQGHTLMLEWLARCALLNLIRVQAERRIADKSGRSDFELFSRFRVEVERHYQEQWQVGQYAQLLRITPARLNRLCRKLAGKTAFDLAQDRLMLEACRKLTYVPASIASIAYELGFQDPAYFSRLFKKLVKVTPKEFRQQTHAATTA
jgi:AraC family transcriptional activator of pobA